MTNRVATVSAGTVVMVLGEWAKTLKTNTKLLICVCRKKNNKVFSCSSGTSPHAVSSVTVTTEMNQANVSWVPGFDGGYTQKFTVWSVTYNIIISSTLSDVALIC